MEFWRVSGEPLLKIFVLYFFNLNTGRPGTLNYLKSGILLLNII
jgi:hypothetical protein